MDCCCDGERDQTLSIRLIDLDGAGSFGLFGAHIGLSSSAKSWVDFFIIVTSLFVDRKVYAHLMTW